MAFLLPEKAQEADHAQPRYKAKQNKAKEV